MNTHHAGAEAQQLAAHDCTTKINGVTRQCIRQRVLANAPILSELLIANFILLIIKKGIRI
tara:strand:+ start:227 stop:409 length:183 start_codon:yes stop_codon:yes gene_type:complete